MQSTLARRFPSLAFPSGQAGGHLRVAAPLRRATRQQEARLPRARSAHDRRRHALRRLPHNRSDLGRTNTGSRKVATGLPDLFQLRGLLKCLECGRTRHESFPAFPSAYLCLNVPRRSAHSAAPRCASTHAGPAQPPSPRSSRAQDLPRSACRGAAPVQECRSSTVDSC